jgi:hypothetical protein
MDNPYVIVLLTVVAVVVIKLLVLLVMGKGSLARVGLATRVFARVMGDPDFAVKAEKLSLPPPPPEPVKRSGEALRLLSLLQREGRLLDFLLEDIESATDDQIGAGVRELHRQAQTIVKEHLDLEPVLPNGEGDTVTVPAGFDPSAIRLTGNVAGQPPFQGVLKHHGWRVKDFRLAAPPKGSDEFVVAPAEVEIQ